MSGIATARIGTEDALAIGNEAGLGHDGKAFSRIVGRILGARGAGLPRRTAATTAERSSAPRRWRSSTPVVLDRHAPAHGSRSGLVDHSVEHDCTKAVPSAPRPVHDEDDIADASHQVG